ncbi:hypothetical protein KIW84_013123 [Lathyrus oleraceus]|uniref:Uncharacterized protein n=1 Tax=Pisum sativum TaxID=3888 RepID=A0A9D5BJ69_PEA|nr:hypothetical protein KIW84_013123 [Pisum sativum]
MESLVFKGSSSVLVNGSATVDFLVGKGLRHGDPFYPFLFILVMEGIGSDLSFVSSRWLGEFTLKEVFPCLYAPSSLLKLSVAEAEELELYLALQNRSPIVDKHDVFLWSASDSNRYTVSYGYNLLLQVDAKGVVSKVLSKALSLLWRAKLPSKI